MLRRIRSRIGSAHLIGIVAVVLALTGTSIALPGKNSVGTDDIKKNGVTTSDIRTGNVRTSDIRNNAVSGTDVAEGSLATVPASRKANNVLWAVVSDPNGGGNATLVRSSSPAPIVAEATGVIVSFSRDVSGCAWNATRGAPDATVEGAGWAQTGGAVGNPNGIDVRVRQGSAANVNQIGSIEDGNFHLMVVCPT